jgi:YjbR protein
VTRSSEPKGLVDTDSSEREATPTPGDVWRSIVERELLSPGVTAGTGFGQSEGLRVGGKIFAMFIGGELVVKLSRARAEEIVAEGRGRPFDPGHGRLMKQWVTVPYGSMSWAELASEAQSFVGGVS